MTAGADTEALARQTFPRSVAPPTQPLLDADARARTRGVLREAGRAERPDAVLLSGGLDSSIAARVASGVWGLGICVLTPDGTDRPYCEAMADHLGMRLRRVEVALDELLDHVADVCRILGTFDPMEVRNAVVQYVGLRAAAEEGAAVVATGDGADELFAGYSYMAAMDDAELAGYRRHIASVMRFAADRLADDLGMGSWSPFLEPPVRDHALALPNEALVRPWKGRRWGKWVLREAFRGELPDAVLWRWKDPLEVGAGSTALPELLAERTDGDAFEEERARIAETDGVRIRDPEHLAYYRAFRRHHRPPRDLEPSQAHVDDDAGRRCPDCRGPLSETARFCRTCGWYGGADPEPDPGPPEGSEGPVRPRGPGTPAGTGKLQIQGDGSRDDATG